MEESLRGQSDVKEERTIAAGAILPGVEIDERDPLGEVRGLAEAAGATIVGEMLQRLDRPRGSTYLGKGKIEELAAMVAELKAKTVVFDNELSPMQIRTIEEALSCKVLDRSELILDIFATRAATREARLQVEIAQLEYTAPRLRAMWSHLGQVTGGAPVGVGTRGPGEQQLEIDRRLVQRRISHLKTQLVEVQARKTREVAARNLDHFTVGLVGYTNAGKSTLFNALTSGGAWEADQLFATLGTRVEAWNLGGGNTALLSDTVGFIRNLPHHLVASFRSTLEETVSADLLVIVLDASDRNADRQLETVRAVLDEIGASTQPRILVLNKTDQLREDRANGVRDDDPLAAWREQEPDAIAVSAREGTGLEALRDVALAHMRGPIRETVLRAPMSDSRLLDFIEKRAEVLDRDYDEEHAVLRVRIGRRQVEQLLARGTPFELDGVSAEQGIATLWPEPSVARVRTIAPHRRDWPDDQVG